MPPPPPWSHTLGGLGRAAPGTAESANILLCRHTGKLSPEFPDKRRRSPSLVEDVSELVSRAAGLLDASPLVKTCWYSPDGDKNA